MEGIEKTGPIQGVIVGDRVHYTHADPAGGKFTPSKPRAAMVIEVSELTGKPTLIVWSTDRHVPGLNMTQGAPVVVMCMCVVDAEFSSEPAGSMAARGCWSWPRRESGGPPQEVPAAPQNDE